MNQVIWISFPNNCACEQIQFSFVLTFRSKFSTYSNFVIPFLPVHEPDFASHEVLPAGLHNWKRTDEYNP